jgi:hypothetical protein
MTAQKENENIARLNFSRKACKSSGGVRFGGVFVQRRRQYLDVIAEQHRRRLFCSASPRAFASPGA